MHIKSQKAIELESKHLFGMNKEDYMRIYSGRLVLKECFLFSKFLISTKMKGLLVFYSVIHAVLPLLIYLLDDLHFYPLTHDKIISKYGNSKFWFYVVSLSISSYLSYLMNGYYAHVATIDM